MDSTAALFEQSPGARIKIGEWHGIDAHLTRSRGVHKQLADDLRGIGQRDALDLSIERAGNDELPETLDGAGRLAMAVEPFGECLGRIRRDRPQHRLKGASEGQLVTARECMGEKKVRQTVQRSRQIRRWTKQRAAAARL